MRVATAFILVALTPAAAAAQSSSSSSAMKMVETLFNDASMAQYITLIGWAALIVGYCLVLASVYKFALLGDGRQRGEDSMGKALTTFGIGVCLICFDAFLTVGRETIAMERYETISYSTAAAMNWTVSAMRAVENMLTLTGLLFVFRSFFAFRTAAHDSNVGSAHLPRAITMMLSGVALTNSGALVNWFAGLTS